MTDTANTTYEGGSELPDVETRQEEVTGQVRTIDGPLVMEEYAELLAREIRAHFPEKRLGEVVALTKEQVRELLLMEFDVENDGEMEQMRLLLVRKKASAPSLLSKDGGRAKTDAGVFELAGIETSKFTTRSFDEKLVSFVGKVSKRILDVLRENQLITGTRQDERAMEHMVKKQVGANISSGLEILDKSINLQNFLEDTDDESTPEERFAAINALEQQRGISTKTLYATLHEVMEMLTQYTDIEETLIKCRSIVDELLKTKGISNRLGFIHKQEASSSSLTIDAYRILVKQELENVEESIIHLLREYPSPFYLFQATDILLRRSNYEFLEWYRNERFKEHISFISSEEWGSLQSAIGNPKEYIEDHRKILEKVAVPYIVEFRRKILEKYPEDTEGSVDEMLLKEDTDGTLLSSSQRYPTLYTLLSSLEEEGSLSITMLEWYIDHIPLPLEEGVLDAMSPTSGEYLTAPSVNTLFVEMDLNIASRERYKDMLLSCRTESMKTLLHCMGHIEETMSEKDQEKIMKNIDDYIEVGRMFLENIKDTIQGLAEEYGVTIPYIRDDGIREAQYGVRISKMKGSDADVDDTIKRNDLLELLSVVNNRSYPIRDRFGAQIIAIKAYYMAMVEASSLYQTAKKVRAEILLGSIGPRAKVTSLYRKKVNTTSGSMYIYSPYAEEGGDIESMKLRFWNPPIKKGSVHQPDEKKIYKTDVKKQSNMEERDDSVYFISPSSVQVKSVESIVTKLVVPNNVQKVVDIFDLVRDSFDIAYTKRDLVEQPELMERVMQFIKYIGDKHLDLKYKKSDAHIDMNEVRSSLRDGEFIIVNKLQQERPDKSSSLYSTIKLYGRKNGVGIEVQFRPLDTVIVEKTEVASHDYYETTRWINYMLELFPYSIYPEMHDVLKQIKEKRAISKAEVEEKVRADYEHHVSMQKQDPFFPKQ